MFSLLLLLFIDLLLPDAYHAAVVPYEPHVHFGTPGSNLPLILPALGPLHLLVPFLLDGFGLEGTISSSASAMAIGGFGYVLELLGLLIER